MSALPVSAAAPAAAPAADAKAAKAAKPKKPKVPRTKYRAEGSPLLTAIPTDYNPRKQLPPGQKDFADEAMFFHFKAAMAQRSMERWAKLASECATLGTPDQRKAQKKLLRMREQFAKMQATLEAELGPEKVAQMLARAAEQGNPNGAVAVPAAAVASA